jgi:hypothetical protein
VTAGLRTTLSVKVYHQKAGEWRGKMIDLAGKPQDFGHGQKAKTHARRAIEERSPGARLAGFSRDQNFQP